MLTQFARLFGLVLVSLLSLQLYFALRVAAMLWLDPQSTTFQRSEAWRLWSGRGLAGWSQAWVPASEISDHLKRAVIASEDAGFVDHSGIEWDAIERAWERNQRAQSIAERMPAQVPRAVAQPRNPRLVGGSTITQQLAKNLFLSGERTLPRKAQEFVIAWMLESLLGKRRILEVYLNHVEWGEGLFGAQAAARHYFRTDASRLGAGAAARLAVMLPAPKRSQRNPGSAYVSGRASIIAVRMDDVALP
jgi:monofunctional biosynthetic peptidoglycan transglycosylase